MRKMLSKENLSIPAELANDNQALTDAVCTKILEGPRANPDFLALLEKLIDPKYKEQQPFIKELIQTFINPSLSIFDNDFFKWLSENYSNISRTLQKNSSIHVTPAIFFKKSVDLFIRDFQHENKQIEANNSESIIFCEDMPSVSANFQGRIKKLRNVKAKLIESKTGIIIVTIKGLMGAGKSSLASKIVDDLQDEVLSNNKNFYNFFGWINLSHHDVKTNFYRLAEALGLSTSDKPDLLLVKDRVKRGFAEKKRILLVVDDVRSLEELNEYLPGQAIFKKTQHYFHCIVTTRNLFMNKGYVIELSKFSKSRAINYVKDRLTNIKEQEKIDIQADDSSIEQLVSNLGCLPMALEKAIDYLRENHNIISMYKYCELFCSNKHQLTLLSWESKNYKELEISHNKTILATCNLSLKKLKKINYL